MIIDYNGAYLESLVKIYHGIFTSPEWGFTWLTVDNTRRYLKDMSAAPRFKGYVLLNGNEAAGGCFGEVSDYFSSVQYTIKEIFIDRRYQGRGRGSAFLSEIEADLAGNKIDNIILSTSKSVRAYGFYMKNGYIESPETVFLVKFLKTK